MAEELQVIEAATKLAEKRTEGLKVFQNIVLVVILGGIFFAIYAGLFSRGSGFLYSLREIEVSRGLITFVVAIATVSIALVLAVYAMASNEAAPALKERFTYAKDVLATLVGILGTILGFYFGTSVNTQTETLAVAAPQIRSGQIVAHIAGGSGPYRYTFMFPGDESRTVQSKMSKDGWIFEPIPQGLKKDDPVSIEVSDSKGKKTTRSFKFAPEPSQQPDTGTAPPKTQPQVQPQAPQSAASK
jgi:hypothetical protein